MNLILARKTGKIAGVKVVDFWIENGEITFTVGNILHRTTFKLEEFNYIAVDGLIVYSI